MTSTRSGNASMIRSASTVGVGGRALGEQDPDVRPGPLAVGGGGERRLGHLVGGEPECGGAPQRLGHDAGQRVRPAAHRRPVHHPGARAVAARPRTRRPRGGGRRRGWCWG